MSRACNLLSLVLICAATSQVFGQPSLLPPPTPNVPPEPLPAPGEADDANSSPWQPPAAGNSTSPPVSSPTPSEQLLGSPMNSGPGTTVAGDGEPENGIVLEQPPRWYERVFLLVPVPWDSGVELGLNGSSGNSETLSIRTGGYVKQESKFAKFNMSSYYNRTASDGEVTQNNAQFDVRNDWLLDERSPWTLFATNNVYYDEFKAYNVQTNVDAGVGYRFYHEKDLELMGRAGGGTSREFGGPDDRWVPESLLGVEYNQKIFATQKLAAKVDYFPEWDMVGEFRLVADASWEVELVQPSNLSLKFSVTDRYDSTPSGAEPNLINYSALVLLKL